MWKNVGATVAGFILVCAATLACAGRASADPAAATILRQALAAQGGEQTLRALHSVQFEAAGTRNELEQSERPEGPYITEFDTMSEVHDFAGDRYRSVVDAAVYPVFSFRTVTVASKTAIMQAFGATKTPGTLQQMQIVRERVALSPERVLLTALDAPDARREADTVLQSVPQNVVSFTLDGAPVRIFLNAYTHLPTAVDYSGPLARSGYWSFLGDVTARTYYSLWWLAKGGIHLPMQWNVERNGLPDQMYVIKELKIDEPLADADLTIPKDVADKYDPTRPGLDHDSYPLGRPDQPAQSLADGIVFIPGAWNTTMVNQGDGVVILEAPIASNYSVKVLAEAQRRFPNAPVKAVVTTSDSWPHIAGIREYVARGIPIYALDLNEPILHRVIHASYASKPDDLQRTPRDPIFHPVSGATTLGTGSNRIVLYPLQGETSERQMMAYFPAHRLLYGSDPFQRDQDGNYFYPQTVSELTDAVARERLDVQRFFMMHVPPTPWADLAAVLHAAAQQDTPDGKL
jgi:hypothetical protein